MTKETEKKRWTPNKRRFVCFLDIMGFKDYIARNKHQDIYKMMSTISDSKQFYNETAEALFDKNILFVTTFSDSVIIFSKDNSQDSLNAITYVSASILADGAKNKIPMKGAMAEGLLTVDKAKSIFFGQPLIDAYLLQENEVFYYGVVCHNSMETFIEDFKSESLWVQTLYEEIKTPLKSGVIRHFNLNWFYFLGYGPDDPKIIKSMTENFNKIIKDFKSKVSGKPRKYIDNTEAVFQSFYPSATK